MRYLKYGETTVSLFYCFFTFLVSCSSQPHKTELCPHIFIYSKEEIKFSETEKQLMCGDPESIAYKVIPLYQAKFSMQGFLQSQGYSHPRFEYDEKALNVFTEERSHLKEVEIISAVDVGNSKIEKEIYRHYRNEVLTPKLLDTIEAKAKSVVRDHGYPCVKVSSKVDPQTGVLTINLQDLMPARFGVVTKEPIEGVDDRALERFYSFSADEPFKERELILTEKRFLRQGIVQATFFQERCKVDAGEFSLNQKFITAPPHTIRFGVGASTEVGPMVRAKWTNQRYGEMASLLEANIQASLKVQSVNLIMDKYFWTDEPRRSLDTQLSFERIDQNTYKETNANFRPHFKWTRDTENRFWQWKIGPTYMIGSFKTELNADNRKFKTGAIEGELLSNTHTYEIFDVHPEEGEFYQFNFDFRHPSMGFSDPLLKLDLTYLKLFWLGHLGNGNFILGLRVNGDTSWVSDDVSIVDLPPSTKFYGGGSDDIRGFKLSSPPDNSGLGALTKFSTKIEFRRTNFFAEKLEGFIFLDTGFFGTQSFDFDPRLFYSPGGGIRWQSPIGMVQAYAAQGLSNKASTSDTLFYLGLGGVF